MPRPLLRSDLPPAGRLPLALFCSLLAHALVLLAPPALTRPPPAPRPPPLQAQLQPPPALPAAPELRLPEETPAAPDTAPPGLEKKKAPPRPKTWTQSVREQLARQQESGQFYPAEAIAQGLEGEVLVYFVLGADGDVAAARVEESSGQPLLDTAAVRAVRRLRGLPGDAPQEALLPVRFRLR